MKYNFVMSRTYVTEMTIVADDEASAWDWVNDNAEAIYEAELEQMNVINDESSLAPVVETHNVSTNYRGFTTGAYKYVGELNQLIGRNAFSCRTTKVDQYPATDWIIFGNDITDDEIDRLNLRQDFIID